MLLIVIQKNKLKTVIKQAIIFDFLLIVFRSFPSKLYQLNSLISKSSYS